MWLDARARADPKAASAGGELVPPSTAALHPGRRLVLFVIVVTLLFGVFGVVLAIRRYDSGRGRVMDDVERQAATVAASVNRYLDDRLDLLGAAATDDAFQGDLGSVEGRLELLDAQQFGFDAGLAWVDGDGVVRAVRAAGGSSPAGGGLTAPRPATGADGWVQVLDAPSLFSRPVVALGVPTRASAGDPASGTLIGAFSLDWLRAYLRDAAPDMEGDVYIVDGDRVVVAPAERPTGLAISGETLERVGRAAREGQDVSTATRTGVTGGDDALVSLAPVPMTGWTVAVERGADSAFARVRQDFAFEIVALGGAAILAIVGAAVVGGRLERLSQREHEVSMTLQRRMLPESLPRLPTVQLAARYRPADTGLVVGGDWYDAFVLPDGRLGIVVGDLAGHGLEAAAQMGAVRSALAALAQGGDAPGVVVARLADWSSHQPGDLFGTLVYGMLDPSTGMFVFASAGHPPPVLVQADGLTRRLTVHGPPLGLPTARPHPTEETKIPAGATLLLYSDGLIERRHESLEVGIDRLEALAERLDESDLEAFADALLDGIAAGAPTQDDVALLLLQLADTDAAPES